MSITTLCIIMGVSAFLICAILLTSTEEQKSVTQKRLDQIKTKTYNTTSEEFDDKITLLVSDTTYRLKFMGQLLRNFKATETIKNSLFIADSKLQVDTFLFLCALCGIICVSAIFFFFPNLLALIGLIACGFPALILHVNIKKRLVMFTQQFPDALGLISSSLRAGHPLLASFETVVQEMPKPVSSVFKTTVDEISLGIDVKEALNSMVKLIPDSLDLKFFVTAVLIQRDVGGNLAELLDGLSETIRERFKLLGQLRAQTAQTRFSGIILSFMPPVVGGVIFFLSPDYLDPLLHTPDGQLALYGAAILMILGLYSIQKITNIQL